MKSPYDILRILIERVILPKYPFLKIADIDSYRLSNVREYDVRFFTNKRLLPKIQTEIFKEIKSLFQMAGLDEREILYPNRINVWFKHPRAKDFSFHATEDFDDELYL